MNRINFHNHIEYVLISQSQGPVVIPEPINFDKGNGNIYTRDDKSKGFLTTKSNDLEFHNAGDLFLRNQSYTKGVAEDVLMQKWVKSEDRLDERWRVATENYLDMAELETDEKSGGKKVSKTKVTEGGLKKLIDSKYDDEFDLTSTIDIDGNTISSLATETSSLPAKELFLRSELSVEENTEIKAIVSGGDNLNARAFPLSVDINSDADNIDSVLGDKLNAVSGDYASLKAANIGNCWLTVSEQNKRLIINGKIKATITHAEIGTGTLDIVIYSGFGEFNFDRKITLDVFDPSNLGEVIEYTFNDYELVIAQGESVTFGLLSNTVDGIRYSVTETAIVVTEDSVFAETTAKCLTYKQVINRLLYLITGTDELVISDLLDTGELSEDILLNGFWIRGFPDIVNEGTDEERKIQFVTSLKQVISHMEALIPVAWWVTRIGDQEYFRIEPKIYTMQNFPGIKFGNTKNDIFTGRKTFTFTQLSKVKRKKLKKNFYSKLEFGSEKGGDNYEEIHGLQSICGKATFSTVNKNQESTYSKLSPYRLGDVDVELPRRKPYSLKPEEDTRFDSDIMCIRAKKNGSIYQPRVWQDAYEQAPTGIYRVDSAYNLEFTPMRLLISHGFVINSGLYHYPNGKIVFSSSNCNSAFKTKKAGENLLEEDTFVEHSRLDPPRIRPYSVECVAQVTQEIEDAIVGETDGVPNWFGTVEGLTSDGIQQFRLVKSDVNDEGKHKFVEAYIDSI